MISLRHSSVCSRSAANLASLFACLSCRASSLYVSRTLYNSARIFFIPATDGGLREVAELCASHESIISLKAGSNRGLRCKPSSVMSLSVICFRSKHLSPPQVIHQIHIPRLCIQRLSVLLLGELWPHLRGINLHAILASRSAHSGVSCSVGIETWLPLPLPPGLSQPSSRRSCLGTGGGRYWRSAPLDIARKIFWRAFAIGDLGSGSRRLIVIGRDGGGARVARPGHLLCRPGQL